MLALCAVALVAAGCGSKADEVAATAQPTSVKTATVGHMYLTVAHLRDAVEDTGLVTCASYQEIADPIGAVQRAECTSATSLSIHGNNAEARASATEVGESVVGLHGGRSVHLVGENWTINCGDDETLCMALRDDLGGKLLVVAPEAS